MNGHDVAALTALFGSLPLDGGKPTAIVCHTVKGKGIGFAEDDPKWHHQSNFKPQVLDDLYASVGGLR